MDFVMPSIINIHRYLVATEEQCIKYNSSLKIYLPRLTDHRYCTCSTVGTAALMGDDRVTDLLP